MNFIILKQTVVKNYVFLSLF